MSADQRQRLVSVITQIRPWIDGKIAQTSVRAPSETSATTAPDLPAAKTLRPAIPAQTTTGNVSIVAPKVNPMRGLRSMLQNEIKTPPSTGMSIVTLIDDVLQSKLMGSSLSSRSIRLEEGRMGEVIVLVGSNRYTSVDEVPDPEIRAIIKAAISDWEKK
jgi:hypothetical protein